jgi:hypothetical protein
LHSQVTEPSDRSALQFRLASLRWQYSWLRLLGKPSPQEITAPFHRIAETPVPWWKYGNWYLGFLFAQILLFIRLRSGGRKKQ